MAMAATSLSGGTLLHIAHTLEPQLERIIQVPYLPKEPFHPKDPRPVIEWGGKNIPLHDSLWAHFRDIRDIKCLEASAGIKIEIFDRPFHARDRDRYTDELIEAIKNTRSNSARPMLVFLDPDTGIAERNAKPTHVKSAEVHRYIRYGMR